MTRPLSRSRFAALGLLVLAGAAAPAFAQAVPEASNLPLSKAPAESSQLSRVSLSMALPPSNPPTPAPESSPATEAPLAASPSPVALATPGPQERELRAVLDASLKAFNAGDFKGYLHDFAPKLHYNGLTVDKKRLVEVNQELRDSFPNLRMSYRSVRVRPLSASEAEVMTVADYSGSTNDYDGSGLPAQYRESGRVTAIYRKQHGKWLTEDMEIAWNDSTIDIGEDFGQIGFTSLPALIGTGQSYQMRLFTGADGRPGVSTARAYALMPLASTIDKAAAEKVFAGLTFVPMGRAGYQAELRAPEQEGTYVHLLVLNKYRRIGTEELPIGQKIYTRLVRVE